ncbi:uncharacterized protein N0V89_012561 [Didymosphaeria variabile]|uniref:Uncharacterized protein n=1 Tax=Didymosphaeria variabile TaxID=1932322 RepID=A0A9W9C560_9PLEO|nr:uncharacterized protein N0V89_012561 [Didymosphaeria variabile]KAJ4344817.1 hypothetical protein N0V89_012561 [Didymosphaeria variabile]
MKLFSILLLIAPVCVSLRFPQSDRVEPRLPFEHRELNLTSLNKSVAGFDRTLARRTFPEEGGYEELVEKGCTLMGMMLTKDEVAANFMRPAHSRTTAESTWTNWQSLNDWGWDLTPPAIHKLRTITMNPVLDPVMQDLGLPPLNVPSDGGFAEAREWYHDHATTHDGILYKPTTAHTEMYIDVTHGLVVATETFGPTYMGDQLDPKVTVVTKLKNLYDLLYLDYAYLAAQKNEPVSNLKYMFIWDIQNEQTQMAVYESIGERLTYASCHKYLWPNRKVFYPHDDAYKAILASPNGRSTALILATHKSVFGERRMIESVTVFCQQPGHGFFNLLFIKKDHDEEEDDSDWTDDEEPEDPGQPTFSVSPWPSPTAASP